MLSRQWPFTATSRLAVAVLLLAIISFVVFGTTAAKPRAEVHPPRPRLVVLLVFDQMRADYLTRWRDLFGAGGFRRLMRDGTWFQNCQYTYADTTTGPGHASLATGCLPAEHGIVMNDWYVRAAAQQVYCVESDRHVRVPPGPERPPALTSKRRKTVEGAVSPERLLAPTFGDLLKEATRGQAKVVALSFKDRAAALLGGKKADGCYWIDTTTGEVITSTYYRHRLPDWVAEFNRSRAIDRWKGIPWTPLRTDLDFRYSLEASEGRRWKSYYQGLYYTAIGNELVADLAERAIDAEQLGRRDVTDFLVVSFSSNDTVGHEWGPDSAEVLDVTLRSDRIVQRLLKTLDSQVEHGRYLLAMSADHGVCPLPEVLRAQGKESARIPIKLLSAHAEDFLRRTFGRPEEKAQWVEASADPWIYLNRALLANRGLDQAAVETELARWLESQPGILKAYTRTQLIDGPPANDPVGLAVWRSFRADRSGDVGVVLKPYYLFDTYLTGTTHGTPHAYDTHVPLLLYGTGIPAQVSQERVCPQAIAAVFARRTGTAAPRTSEAPYPTSLRETHINLP